MKLLSITITFTLLFTIVLAAQWSNDPTINTPICLAPSYQDRPQIVSDGSGGVIITWVDNRNPPLNSNGDIYAQRIGVDGYVKWTTDGIGVCNNPITQNSPQIISDGSGGAIIVWEDLRNGLVFDIYAQRINSSGIAQWATDGVPICTSVGPQRLSTIVADGAGGAFITWLDTQAGHKVYAQRVNSNGIVQWTSNGVPLCPGSTNQKEPQIIADGSGGAIVMWIDNRTGVNENDVYAQRITGDGNLMWSEFGLPVCAIYRRQQIASIAPDGSGGAIIAWTDDRDTVSLPLTSDVYAQRVNSNGTLLWASNGVPIAVGPGNQKAPQILASEDGGAIIVWDDTRNGSNNRDIYAQRIGPTGSILWSNNGIAICDAPNDQDWQRIISDGNGGAIISWEDERFGGNNRHIYAQRIDATGSIQWANNGIPISTAPGYKSFSQMQLIGLDDVVFTWGDERLSSSDRNIYAQQISKNGQLGFVTDVYNENQIPVFFELFQNYPNPFNPNTKIRWSLPVSSHQTLKVFDVLGNEVAKLVDEYKPAGSYEIDFDASSASGGLSSGVYFYRLQADGFIETKKMTILR